MTLLFKIYSRRDHDHEILQNIYKFPFNLYYFCKYNNSNNNNQMTFTSVMIKVITEIVIIMTVMIKIKTILAIMLIRSIMNSLNESIIIDINMVNSF